MEMLMKWTGDRCDHLPSVPERVLWAVYGDGLDLSGDPEMDIAATRSRLADQEALRTAHLRGRITSGQEASGVA